MRELYLLTFVPFYLFFFTGTKFCGNSPVDPVLLSLVRNEFSQLSSKVDDFVCNCKGEKDKLETSVLELKKSLYQEVLTLHEKFEEREDKVNQKFDQIEDEVKTLKQQVVDLSSEKSKENAKFPKFFGALDRNEYFTGRKKEMEKLEKAFAAINTTPDVRAGTGKSSNVHGICGLGGCGKSSLAFEYAWRNMECYPDGVFVVNGESDDLLRQSLQRIYEEFIAAGNVRSNQQAETFEQVLSQTLSWLGNLRDKWLLIVDNMDQKELSPSTRRILLGQWKTKSSGHILVTSRRRPEDLCEVLNLAPEGCFELNPWSLDESVEFLKKRTELPFSSCQDQEEKNLAEELGGLPLALEQAAAYIKALKCPIHSYLLQYHVQKSLLLNFKSAKPRAEIHNEERLAVQTTWLLNFSYISNVEKDEGLGKAAAFFMKIAAYLSPDEIPVEILNVGAPEVDHGDLKKRLELTLGAEQIVELLVKFSLFKRRQRDTLSIHRLVQETLRDSLSCEDETTQVLSCAMRMMHQTFLNCVGATDFFRNFYDRLKFQRDGNPKYHMELEDFCKILFTSVDVPLESRRWKKLAANATHLVGHLLNNLPLKPRFFCEESARIFCEAALYCYSLGMESEGYHLQQLVMEIICAIKEPIRYYKDDGLLKVTRILRPFTDSAVFANMRLQVPEREAGKRNDEMGLEAKKTALLQIISETIEMIEPKAKDAFSKADFQTSAELYSVIVKISNFSVARGAKKGNEAHLVPLGRILCGRGISHLKMENFEAAFDDFDAAISVDIQCYRGYYWKTYASCKLAERGRTEFTSRAQAAFAVLHFKFKDSKLDDIQKLEKRFPKLLSGIEYKFVSKVSELKELEQQFGAQNDFSNVSLTIILAPGSHYDLKRMAILGGRVNLVCLPGNLASLNCIKGLCLSQGSYLFENVEFLNPYPIIPAMATSVTPFGKICNMLMTHGKGIEEKLDADNFDTLTLGRKQTTDSELTVTGQTPRALVEARDVRSLVMDHCEIIGPKTSGLVIQFTDSFIEERSVSVRLTKIIKCSRTGLCLQESLPLSHIRILNSSIAQNLLHGICIDSPSPFHLERNYIFSNTLSGVVVVHSREGILLRNAFVHNAKHGILLAATNVVMEENYISNNRGWGIVCTRGSNLDCKETSFQDNLCGGIRIIFNGEGNVSVRKCESRGSFGPFVFPKDQPSKMEVEYNPLFTVLFESSVAFLINCFLEGIYLTPECITGKLNRPLLSGNRVSEDSVRFDIEPKFCSTCGKNRETNNSDETECLNCHIAVYCCQQCCDRAKPVHDPICKSILEANKELFVEDLWPLSNAPSQVDYEANRSGNSLCIIANVTLTHVSGEEARDIPYHLCLLICPQRKVWSLVYSVIIHHFIAIHGSHCPDRMMDTKAASILANFDSESKLITVYKHRIFPLEKVPDALMWLDHALNALGQHLKSTS